MTRPADVQTIARPVIETVWALYAAVPLDIVVQVAALVEIAGASATYARDLARRFHVDPRALIPAVSSPVDVYAVLGRGRWLPTMTVPQPLGSSATAASVVSGGGW